MQFFPIIFCVALFLFLGIYAMFISFLKEILLNPFVIIPIFSIASLIIYKYWRHHFPENYDTKIWRFAELSKKPWNLSESLIQEFHVFEIEEKKINDTLNEQDKIGKVGEIIIAKIVVLKKHFSLLVIKEAQISERCKSFSSQNTIQQRISQIEEELKIESDQLVSANLTETKLSLERQFKTLIQSETFLRRGKTKRLQIIESVRELQAKIFSIENIDVKLAEGIAQKIDNQIKDASLVIQDLEASLEEATKNTFF